MSSGVRDIYNVAINGKGYILRGSPNSPSYSRSVVRTEIDRLAISDLQYSDFSGAGIFYIAQTDWSGGIKNEKVWRDDAKFYYSTNIDAYSEPGSFKLELNVTTQADFTEVLVCGGSFEVNSSRAQYVGTEDSSADIPRVYTVDDAGNTNTIAGTTFGTAKNIVSQLLDHKNQLYASNVGAVSGASANFWTAARYNGTSWFDMTSTIVSAITGSNFSSARCSEKIGSTLYICGDHTNAVFIVSTDDDGGSFTQEVYLQTQSKIVCCKQYNGKLYYLLVSSNFAQLRVFDPATSADSEVSGATFFGHSIGTFYGKENLLRVFLGKLILTIPNEKVYSFDGSTLSLIFDRDDAKNSIGAVASVNLERGCIEVDSRLVWGNLIYDGEAFFNHKKDASDDTTNYLLPLYTNSDGKPKYISEDDESILLKNSTNYKTSLANSYLVFSEMSQISKIDKLLHSITLIFDPFNNAQEGIQVQYSIDDMATWTTLPTLSSSTEGSGTIREIFIPNNILYNKIWVKVHLQTGDTTTPVVHDVVVAYKPMPDYKNVWKMRLEMSDSFKLLDKSPEARTSYDLMSELWKEKINKRKVLFEDVDYFETTLTQALPSAAVSANVDSTRLFPKQGRIRIVSAGVAEEMTYTSANINTLFGITRAQRGTKARTYPSGTVVKNDFDVVIDDVRATLNFTDENKTEGIAEVILIEL